jgi:hypothetical protein
VLKAATQGPCELPSPDVEGSYPVGQPSAGLGPLVQSSLHIGNSLTDTLVGVLSDVSRRGGVTLEFQRYTIPGAGLWMYVDNPTGGFGVDNVQLALATRPFDHLVMQPYPNSPCQPGPSADGDDSDAGYVSRAWSDALASNPDVELWIFQQWPSPTELSNCFTGGGWTRGGWNPPNPDTFRQAVQNEHAYHQAVVAELERMHPDRNPPRLVAAGNALLALEDAIARGELAGVSDFYAYVFSDGGQDIHLTAVGAYFVAEVFYARLFSRDPRGKSVDATLGLGAAQAAVLQSVAWNAAVD